jgi:hypothetical protein
MPELDELLREAADDAASRARAGDVEAVVGGARRRRGRLAATGAAGFVAAVMVGVAVVAGLPVASPPAPQPATTAAPVPVTPEELVRSVATEVPYIAWRFDSDSARTKLFTELNVSRTPLSTPYFKHGSVSDDEIRKYFPRAGTGGDFLMLTGGEPPTRSQGEQFAADLRSAPGVRDATLETARGYWFMLSATAPRTVTGRRGRIPMPPDGKPALQRAKTWHEPLGDGRERWTGEYFYVTATLDAVTLQKLRSDLATAWGLGIEATTVTPLAMPPG